MGKGKRTLREMHRLGWISDPHKAAAACVVAIGWVLLIVAFIVWRVAASRGAVG